MRSTLYCAVHATRWPLSTAIPNQLPLRCAEDWDALTYPLFAGLQRARRDRAQTLHPHNPRAIDVIHEQALSGD